MFRNILVGVFILFVALSTKAQQMLTADEVVSSALMHNKIIQFAALDVQLQQQKVKTAAGYSPTFLVAERSPYDLIQAAAEQQFEWPSVYWLRKKAQQERVEVSRKQQQLTLLDITLLIKETYLETQYLSDLLAQVATQDSLYENILLAAMRNFEAGQINKLEEQFTTNQYLLVHNTLIRTQSELTQWKAQLSILMGDSSDFQVQPMAPYVFNPSSNTLSNVRLEILSQLIKVSEAELKAIRAENLPGLITALSLPLEKPYENIIGFRAGVSLPLFSGQNKNRIMAGQTGIELARTQWEAQQQQFEWQLSNALKIYNKEKTTLDYYNFALLANADEIIRTALRFFTAGEVSYIETLRNVANGFETKISYLATLKKYNQAILEYQYLTGTL